MNLLLKYLLAFLNVFLKCRNKITKLTVIVMLILYLLSVSVNSKENGARYTITLLRGHRRHYELSGKTMTSRGTA